MRLSPALCLAALCALPSLACAADENRCGWFSNPTPGNAWLTDRDGEWTISIQGGAGADGDWPEFKPRDWVVTNSGGHGYGCACMRMSVDRKDRRVLAIKSATPKPLATCRNDRALREPK